MHTRALVVIASMSVCMLLLVARADAATCAFDPSSGLLTVSMQGTWATLQVASGVIELDGAACGGATTTSTARIVVSGLDNDIDKLTLVGRFAPGRNDVPETDRAEIEIEVVGFNDVNDWIILMGGTGNDVWRFTASGINLNGDQDEDLTLPSNGRIGLRPRAGDDVVDAGAYTGPLVVGMRAGDGNDVLTGSPADDDIRGDAGNDTIYGMAGNDVLYDGPGNDLVRGGAGNDRMWGQGAAPDGADDFRGNGGIDEVSYIVRDSGVTVTIDDVANDGAPGEADNVHLDVEDVTGGSGDDVLVGSSADNVLDGTWGSNEVYGGAGNDWVDGGVGDASTSNIVVGDAGNDHLSGGMGDDFLDGGDGNDTLEGFAGDDTLDGGAGTDRYYGGYGNDVIHNADGLAETVNCGPDTDDPQPDAGDTFIDCENI